MTVPVYFDDPPDYGDTIDHDDDLAGVAALLTLPMTPAEAAGAAILGMFGGTVGAPHRDGITPISFGTVTDAAAWACATGMTARVQLRDPVTVFTVPAVVLLNGSA